MLAMTRRVAGRDDAARYGEDLDSGVDWILCGFGAETPSACGYEDVSAVVWYGF